MTGVQTCALPILFMTDVDGVFLDKDLPESLISELSVKKAEEMIDSGVIAGGMIPKVKSCMEALELGIKNTVIINSKKPIFCPVHDLQDPAAVLCHTVLRT